MLDSLRTLTATLLALVCTRVELISIEFQEEKVRYKQMLLSLVLVAVFLGASLLLIAFFVVVLCWDNYRLWALGGMIVLYLGMAFLALFQLNKILRQSSLAFSASLQEFSRDQQLFRRRDG